jgi:hypothetical protein
MDTGMRMGMGMGTVRGRRSEWRVIKDHLSLGTYEGVNRYSVVSSTDY